MTKRSLAAALCGGGRTGTGVEEAAIEAREARVGSLPALSILHVADKVVQSQEPCLLVVRIGILDGLRNEELESGTDHLVCLPFGNARLKRKKMLFRYLGSLCQYLSPPLLTGGLGFEHRQAGRTCRRGGAIGFRAWEQEIRPVMVLRHSTTVVTHLEGPEHCLEQGDARAFRSRKQRELGGQRLPVLDDPAERQASSLPLRGMGSGHRHPARWRPPRGRAGPVPCCAGTEGSLVSFFPADCFGK